MEQAFKKTYRITDTNKPHEGASKSKGEAPVDDLIEQGAVCPYYQRDRGEGRVYCECARFRFPDKETRREIVYAFCAHPEGYKRCALKQAMDHFYERKYEKIEK